VRLGGRRYFEAEGLEGVWCGEGGGSVRLVVGVVVGVGVGFWRWHTRGLGWTPLLWDLKGTRHQGQQTPLI
jgi:hypothetical protein